VHNIFYVNLICVYMYIEDTYVYIYLYFVWHTYSSKDSKRSLILLFIISRIPILTSFGFKTINFKWFLSKLEVKSIQNQYNFMISKGGLKLIRKKCKLFNQSTVLTYGKWLNTHSKRSSAIVNVCTCTHTQAHIILYIWDVCVKLKMTKTVLQYCRSDSNSFINDADDLRSYCAA